jgi:ABC-type Co2+ transport system permease subunit
MNSPLGTKNRPWRARVNFVNGETVSIARGTPLVLNPADLGQVLIPSGSAGVTVAHSLFAGVAASTAAPGAPVEVIAAGYVHQAILVSRTRAGTTGTDVWASVAARAVGNVLTIDTVNNAFAYSAAGAAASFPFAAVLLQSIASIASADTSTANSATVQTTTVKMWVRALS